MSITDDAKRTHTPTPWRVYDKATATSNFGNHRARIVADLGIQKASIGYVLGGDGDEREVAEANAAHIVKCVNSHDALVEAAKALIYGDDLQRSIDLALAALKLARGES